MVKNIFNDELADSMNRFLKEEKSNLEEAIGYLHSAAELLETLGFQIQADNVLKFIVKEGMKNPELLNKIAGRKKKKKTPVEKKKSEDKENEDYKNWFKFLNSKKGNLDIDVMKLDERLRQFVEPDNLNSEDSILNMDINDADLEVYEKDFDTDNSFEDE